MKGTPMASDAAKLAERIQNVLEPYEAVAGEKIGVFLPVNEWRTILSALRTAAAGEAKAAEHQWTKCNCTAPSHWFCPRCQCGAGAGESPKDIGPCVARTDAARKEASCGE